MNQNIGTWVSSGLARTLRTKSLCLSGSTWFVLRNPKTARSLERTPRVVLSTMVTHVSHRDATFMVKQQWWVCFWWTELSTKISNIRLVWKWHNLHQGKMSWFIWRLMRTLKAHEIWIYLCFQPMLFTPSSLTSVHVKFLPSFVKTTSFLSLGIEALAFWRNNVLSDGQIHLVFRVS